MRGHFRPTQEQALSYVLGAFWLGFAFWAIRDGVIVESPVHVVFFVLNMVIAVLYFLRHDPVGYPTARWTYLVALAGTFYVYCFNPGDGQAGHVGLATAVMCTGGCLAIWAALSLGKGFGVRPVLREVRTAGPYAIVRHPLYTSYITMDVGELIGHTSLWNAVVVLIGTGLLIWRIHLEEAVLVRDPDYRRYMNKVRSRLLPGASAWFRG